MKRVKQISFDVLVNEKIDGCDLAEEIADFLETHGYTVVGAGFQEDMTETYKEDYPDLF